jgi:hypothetical protein
MHEFLEVLSADLTQIAAIIGAILGMIAALRTIRTRRDLTATKVQGEETHAQLTRVEHRWNGRLDELLEATRLAAYRAGQNDELRTQLQAVHDRLLPARRPEEPV